MTAAQENEKRAWLDELTAQRMTLKRQLFAADAQSASLSSGGGAKSYTNRSIDDIKAKLQEIEKEIVSVCAELGEEPPFTPSRPVYALHVDFR